MNSPTPHCPQTLIASIRQTLLGLGLVALMISPTLAQSNREQMLRSPTLKSSSLSLALKQDLRNSSFLPDGTYLYGQSDKPAQIGSEYLVFKVTQGKIRGAIYYPQSEFNCFTGTFTHQQMALSIRDPQDNRAYPYNIALVATSPIANRESTVTNFTLKDYSPLQQLSPMDKQILDICLNQGK